NAVTPAEVVEKYSADGLRYWSGSVKLGTDTVYDETKLGEGRKLINKLFNATKFALRHLVGFDPHTIAITYPTDSRLTSPLNAAQFSHRRSIHEEPWPTVIAIETVAAAARRREDGGQRPPPQDGRGAADLLIHTVAVVRKWKSERGVSIKKPLVQVDIYLSSE